ncbi:MAG: hypothetical protein QME63_00395 [Actinomycetota bacterium]|nr:hypothetical protein [Actinomycetota bacterium]
MAKTTGKPAKKPYAKALLFGVLSLALYIAVFANEVFVRSTWAKGGVYAILPIVTVFVFSFVHGTFADSLMSSLGIVAKKKK